VIHARIQHRTCRDVGVWLCYTQLQVVANHSHIDWLTQSVSRLNHLRTTRFAPHQISRSSVRHPQMAESMTTTLIAQREQCLTWRKCVIGRWVFALHRNWARLSTRRPLTQCTKHNNSLKTTEQHLLSSIHRVVQQILNMSHPAHPATVHFPITTTLLTAGLDAVYFASTFGPTASIVASTCTSISHFSAYLTDRFQSKPSASHSTQPVSPCYPTTPPS
jgi:hypothetical protein